MELTDDLIDKHLDAVLRASGSALRHYSMQKTRDDMRAAMHAFVADFLSSSGQYVTNDASREAALEQAKAEEREACAHEGWMAASWDCEDRVKAAILARGQK